MHALLNSKHVPVACPAPRTAFFIAKGNALDAAAGSIAAALSGLPVQVVERDRDQRLPACALPQATQVIEQETVGRCRRAALPVLHRCSGPRRRGPPSSCVGTRPLRLRCRRRHRALLRPDGHGLQILSMACRCTSSTTLPDLIAEAVRQHDHLLARHSGAAESLVAIPAHVLVQGRARCFSSSPLTTALELAAFEPPALEVA